MQPAEVEAGDGDVAADEQRRVDGLPRAAGVADRDRRAERTQELERRREELAADRVEDHVDLLELVQPLVRDRFEAPSERGSSSFSCCRRRADLGAERARRSARLRCRRAPAAA